MSENDTDDTDTENDREPAKRKVKDLSHTHPHTNEPFGSTGTYDRGGDETSGQNETDEDEDEDESGSDVGEPGVDDDDRIPDGGTNSDAGRSRSRSGSLATGRRSLADLDHSPPPGVGAQDAYDRGGEGRPDAV